MDLTEKTLQENKIFDGRLLQVYSNDVELPNGKAAKREVVRHPGGACVCAIDEAMNVTFVRQFRYAYNSEVLELPAGKLEPGEPPMETAARELIEEAGLKADMLLPMGEAYPSPGYTDEVIYMYLALNAYPVEQDLDEDEFLNIEKIYIGDALQMVLKGDIKDAKTQIALLKAYLVIDNLNETEARG